MTQQEPITCAMLLCTNQVPERTSGDGWTSVPRYAPSSAIYPAWVDYFCPEHKENAK